MWKHSKLFKCKWLFMQIIAFSIGLNEAAQCTDCKDTILGTESQNTTYGPSNEYNCNCDWTIPTSMDTDHETAVVLLLQNVSLPMTTMSSSSPDCTGTIRFPSTDGHSCYFTSNYCLVFATASTICNISKIRKKISVANHTCDSIIPWNKAGGGPYKIQYYAGNHAGYTKYFTIQYLVVDCRSPTATFKPSIATTNGWETTTKNSEEISTTLKDEQISKDKITKAAQQTTISDSDRTVSHSTTDLDKNATVTTGTNGSSASLMIGIPVSGIVGFIFAALSMFFI
ncbi:uncharacterized protein LOC144429676 [Styela clava]